MRSLLLLAAFIPGVAFADLPGHEVYDMHCKGCHAEGQLGAPKFGDRRVWRRLIREGLDDLVPSALSGLRKMPPKGGNPALSDVDVASAVIFMANEAGAAFPPATASDITRWRSKADRRSRRPSGYGNDSGK